MGEKINGGRSAGKEFADSSFQSPDLNLNTHPTTTTTTHHDLILQDFLTSSSACGDQANSAHLRGAQVNQPLNRPPSFSQVMYANTPCYLSALNSPFEALAAPTSSTTLFGPFLKKKFSEDHNCSSDWRYKRMMKNRESAARSRARRMAYTIELETNKKQLKGRECYAEKGTSTTRAFISSCCSMCGGATPKAQSM